MTNNDPLVGHTERSLSPSRTLQSLYINLLLDILAHEDPWLLPSIIGQNHFTKMGNQSFHYSIFDFTAKTPLTLLIVVKIDGTSIFPLIFQQLEPLCTAG